MLRHLEGDIYDIWVEVMPDETTVWLGQHLRYTILARDIPKIVAVWDGSDDEMLAVIDEILFNW